MKLLTLPKPNYNRAELELADYADELKRRYNLNQIEVDNIIVLGQQMARNLVMDISNNQIQLFSHLKHEI